MTRVRDLSAVAMLCLLLSACPRGGSRVVDPDDFGRAIRDYEAASCSDDGREEDDEIVSVLARTEKTGEKVYAVSCPGDDDLFSLPVEGRAAALVTWNPVQGDLFIDLLDANGRALELDGPTDFRERHPGRILVQRLGVTGPHFLRVRNREGTPVKYRVEVTPNP